MRDRQEDVLEADPIEEDVQYWYSQDDEEIETVEVPKLGRPRIPEQWSRCISIENYDQHQSYSYDLASDLQMHSDIVSSLDEAKQHRLIFWPKDYYAGLSGWDLEVHQLSKQQMR